MSTASVVIPVRNAAQSLEKTFHALTRLVPQPDEVLLVDNNSSDSSPQLIREFQDSAHQLPIHTLYEARCGASTARNAGIRAANGNLVAFTDADCIPASDWLLHLLPPFQDPLVGAVAGRVVPAASASTLEIFSALYTLQLPKEPSVHRRWTPWAGGFPTANLMVRRKLLEELNGFDEAVGIYGEDYDLCARLYDRGFTITYVPKAQVAHQHRTTLRGILRQAFGFGRSHSYLLRRHTQKGLWLEVPQFSAHWPRFPVRAWVDLASADKKVLAIALLAAYLPMTLVLLPAYFGWLAWAAAHRAKASDCPVSCLAALQLAGLLLLKSAAMTAGRWWGSVKYGALCF